MRSVFHPKLDIFKKNSQFSFFLAVTVGKVAEAIRAIQMMCRVPPESHHQLEAVMVLEVGGVGGSPVSGVLAEAGLTTVSLLADRVHLTDTAHRHSDRD